MTDTDRNETGRDGAGSGADRVGALIRLAGPRQDAPRARRERVERAVRAHWRRETAGRARRRPWLVAAPLAAAVLLAVVGLAVWRGGPVTQPRHAAAVETVRAAADVSIDRPGRASAPTDPIRAGERLAPGTRVATGEEAGLALRTATGHALRLAPSSRLALIDGATVRLERGAIFVDSRGFGPGADDPLVVRTPLGSVVDVGTVYEVALLADTLRVRVREGRVTLNVRRDGVVAEAGEEVEVSADGSVLRAPIAPDDPAWAWAGALLPPLDLDGRSLDEFLAWAAREGGWRVVYRDEEIAREAPRIALSGSIAGLTLGEALDAVLATCDARYEVRDGDLRVASTRPSADS